MRAVWGALLLGAAIVLSPLTVMAEDLSNYFWDVPSTSPYLDDINMLHDNNIVTGEADGSFHPEENVTRAEFATMLVRTFSLLRTNAVHLQGTQMPIPNHFRDASASWASDNIEIAWERGLISGTSDTTFSPGGYVKREEAATMVWRYLKQHGVSPANGDWGVDDADPWAKESVSNILAYKLYGAEVNGSYMSKNYMKRQEVASLLADSLRLMYTHGDVVIYDAVENPPHVMLEGDGSVHEVNGDKIYSPYTYADVTIDRTTQNVTVKVPSTGSKAFQWQVKSYLNDGSYGQDPGDSWQGESANTMVFTPDKTTSIDVALINVQANLCYASVEIWYDKNNDVWQLQPITNDYISETE